MVEKFIAWLISLIERHGYKVITAKEYDKIIERLCSAEEDISVIKNCAAQNNKTANNEDTFAAMLSEWFYGET